MKNTSATVSLLMLLAAGPAWAADTSSATQGGQAGAEEAVNQQDRQFVDAAAAGSRAEIEMGKLAEQRAGEPAVREYGLWMQTDHTIANDALDYISQRAGLHPRETLDPRDQAAMTRLQTLSGTQFDQAYVPLQVKMHEHTLALFQEQARSGENARLKRFTAHMTPMLQVHLKEAEDLAKLRGIASTGRSSTTGMSGSSTAGHGSAASRLNQQELNRTETNR